MTKKQLALEIINRLKKEYPDASCTLDYKDAWKLLISVRLAAQCTDERVNKIVPDLYKKYPTIDAIAEAPVEEIEKIVKEIVEETGATTIKDMGKVMKIAKERIGTRADGKDISDAVKKILA